MISRFFIDRPIFAAVLSILVTLAGAVAVWTLPLAQFPAITPPTVSVSCVYPGASAEDVAKAVAAPIEQQVNGVERMLYMSSSCANDGSYGLTVTFAQGTDLNMAQVLVQNRVSLAIPALPDVIKQTGVITRKRSPDILMGIAIQSPDGRYDQLFLSNYAVMQIKDEISRVPGVGDVFVFGERDYSMRIWLNPDRLAARGLTASDVVRALREQNAQLAAGAIGQAPMPKGQELQITLHTAGRLTTEEEFGNIILKTTRDGRTVRVKDVGRVELGPKNQDVNVRLDGRDTVFIAIFQLPDANALSTHDQVLDKMAELSQHFPEGLTYDVGFDTTPYTRESIKEVFITLFYAVVLVALVVVLFLQNWRSAVIPLVAVPVAIIGTFAAMALFHFSLNNLTLFGLVLAIGIVVDDAIVVVEAVEHHIERGLEPRQAAIRAMEQVAGPVIAVGLVLSAVFVPCAFISGITGLFFRQFALTIAVSTLISTFSSLTLSPALAATLLRPRGATAAPPLPRLTFAVVGGALAWLLLSDRLGRFFSAWSEPAQWAATAAYVLAGAALGWAVGDRLNRLLGALFRAFNRAFGATTNGYVRAVGGLVRVSLLVLLVYGGLMALTGWAFLRTPQGFIPNQDMGYLLITVQLPDSAAMERTERVMHQVEEIARATPGIKHVSGISGQSFALGASGSNFGTMFIGLKDYAERRRPDLASDVIAAKLQMRFAREVYDGVVFVLGPPPVRGVGRNGGFTLMVEDRGDLGPQALQAQTENLVRRATRDPRLTRVFSAFRANVPQLHIDPDLRECQAQGVDLSAFANTLQVYEGSLYVNDFNLFGRTWQVILQAEAPFRDRPEAIPQLKVRNARGAMVPLGSLATVHEVNGPLVLTRYNMYPAASISGQAVPGISSRQAIDLMRQLADAELPKEMKTEWTDMSYLELDAGNTAMGIFAFAVVMVFLVLAAQYESWALPLAVILVVPVCLLSAVIGVNVARQDINIFTQVGFVVLVGLASKNAILIVEFAKDQREGGASVREATLEACKLRLRPIIMTSLAFILGVIPLIVANGAGAEMRKTLGTAVFSGMIGVTIFGIFLTPVFFYTIDRLGGPGVWSTRWFHRAGVALRGLATLPIRRVQDRLNQRPALKASVPAPDWRGANGAADGNGAHATPAEEAPREAV